MRFDKLLIACCLAAALAINPELLTFKRLEAQAAKWCGSRSIWYKGTIIPDEVYAPGGPSTDLAKFYNACRTHDIGYWTPEGNKIETDRNFLFNLQSECKRAYNTYIEKLNLPPCYGLAQTYYEIMLAGSKDSWTEGQQEASEALNLLRQRLSGTNYNPDNYRKRIGELCPSNTDGVGHCLADKVVTQIVAELEVVNSPVMSAGRYRVDQTGAIYYANGNNHYCWYQSWGDYVRLTGGVRDWKSIPSTSSLGIYDGVCRG